MNVKILLYLIILICSTIVYMKEKYEEIFLEDVIAIDFDDKHYRFYLESFNPKYIGDIKTKVYKPDGQLGSLGLPYTFNKDEVKYMLRRFANE